MKSKLMLGNPEIREIDLNPTFAFNNTIAVADARFIFVIWLYSMYNSYPTIRYVCLVFSAIKNGILKDIASPGICTGHRV